MARIPSSKAIELISTPKNTNEIDKARDHESRLIFHCEPILEETKMPKSALRDYFEWVGSLLPADKLRGFKKLMKMPIDTVESTKAIFDELGKFLSAEDKYVKFDFVSDNIAADFEDYSQKIDDANFWRTKGLDALKTGINSMLVVDLASEQTTSRPEPYYYLVSIFNILDVELNPISGRCEYLIFKRTEDGKVIVIDDEFYRVCVLPEKASQYVVEFEAPHSFYTASGELISGLGYCPACSFYDAPIHNSARVNKRGPLTDVLAKLDWLLFFRTSKKYLDTYAAYPIFVTYKSTCEYRDEKGNNCHEGFINYSEWDTVNNCSIDQQKKCPSCSARETVGPGSFWEVDAPADKDDVDMLKNPVTIVEISNDKLEYGVTEIQRLEDEIYLDCVGYDGDAMANKAVNETQVGANFESKESVLESIKTKFEVSHKFVMETICRLRYGSYFLRSVVDYGTEYFMKSAEDMLAEYKLAKDSGMPMYYVSTLREQISRTRFKNNPEQQQRDYILSQLEPYPDLNILQLSTFQLQYGDPLGYIIKLNFTSFIQRFEREQMNVIEFGSLISFDKKINLINSKLLDYATERQQKAIAQPEPGGNKGSAI